MTIPVNDTVTGKHTSVVELAAEGKPVIIHTFAVWCSACSMQLRETAKLVKNNPNTYTVLGIDIDPRENADMVKNHVEKNHFVGMYGAAPPDMTRSLMKTFGNQIVASLPQTLVVCNKSVTYIGDGAFPEAKLKEILTEVC
ncbi:MAG: redoxin family protein [Methanobacteriota archaeon]